MTEVEETGITDEVQTEEKKPEENDGSEEPKTTEPVSSRKLFVGGLDYKTTDETLRAHFEQWGELTDVVVMQDIKKNRSRGFGYVTFATSAMLEAAQNAKPHEIDGRVVEPKRAVPRRDDAEYPNVTGKKLFIAGIKEEHEEEDLRDYFSPYGTITSIDLVIDKKTGKKRKYAFVEFDESEPVDKITLIENHFIKDHRMDVKKACSNRRSTDRKRRGDWNRDNGGGSRNRGGNWGNGGGNWGNGGGNWGNGGGNWGNGGGNMGNGWGNMGNGWGNMGNGWGNGGGYQQGWGGGPMRGGNFNRSAPFGNFNNQQIGGPGGRRF